MQGRLSKPQTGRIQEFPIQTWQDEFRLASSIGLSAIEWTVDFKEYRLNPIFNLDSQSLITKLSMEFGISVPSITLDCFVDAPIHAINTSTGLKSEVADLIWVAKNICIPDLNLLVLPIVAEAGDFNLDLLNDLIRSLEKAGEVIADLGKKVAIECEFETSLIKILLDSLDPLVFGVNFDMGNSAALGHSAREEIRLCRDRIFNVHIKDRKLGGKTVPLGEGCVDFSEVDYELKEVGYKGNKILQAARIIENHEVIDLSGYVGFCEKLGWGNA
jgi:hexulose-6-phosphate isomerase